MASVSVTVPDHPFSPCDAMQVDRALLASWESEYIAESGSPDVARFLFGEVAVRVFDALLGEESRELAAESAVWLMHLSGYFGGVWLRSAIRAAQPDNALMKAGAAPTREAFDLVAGRASQALAASRTKSTIPWEALRSMLSS